MKNSEEIINRVEKSGLITLDLADYSVEGKRKAIDIKKWLWECLIMKEVDFRKSLEEHNWQEYKDCYVAVFCSSDAIIPDWAYMLVTSKLIGIAKRTIQCDLNTLQVILFEESLNKINSKEYVDKRVLIKGCGSTYVPPSAYVKMVELLQPHVKSLMFGEACSSVPVFKAPK